MLERYALFDFLSIRKMSSTFIVQTTCKIETGNEIFLFCHSFSFVEANNSEVNYMNQP